MFGLLAHSRTVAEQLPEKVGMHLQRAAGHNVVERGHAAEQRHVLERACDAAVGSVVRAHLGARFALERDPALLRMVEAVDDIEHRGLAGPVRPDDRANFPFADVERHIAHCLHATESERHVLHRQQHIADRNVRTARGSHAAFPMAGTGSVFMSRIFTRALMVPLRPSSKVTSVEISASFDPSYSALINGA